MSEPVLQHVVPKWVLRQFLSAGSAYVETLHAEDGWTRSRRASPKVLGRLADRYTLTDHEDRFAVEKLLNAVEGAAASAKEAAPGLLENAPANDVRLFLAFQMYRTDRLRRSTAAAATWKLDLLHLFASGVPELEALAQNPDFQAHTFRLAYAEARPEIGTGADPRPIRQMVTLALALAELMADWPVQLVHMPSTQPLVVADHPCVWVGEDPRPGLEESLLWMPVGPHSALVTGDPGSTPIALVPAMLPAPGAQALRRLQLQQAEAWVAFRREDLSLVVADRALIGRAPGRNNAVAA